MSHGIFVQGVEVVQAWDKTGGELHVLGGGVQITNVTASEKRQPQILKIFIFKVLKGILIPKKGYVTVPGKEEITKQI